MTFAKMQPKKYPRRLWALAGEAGSGKSTFATQLRGPLLLIDADHRFDEVVHLTNGDVLSISEQPIDHIISDRIAVQLRSNMPGAKVGTIVVDSLTAIIKPLTVRAVRDNDAGVNKNKVAGFKDKATAMSQIQDAVTAWGTDVLWVWHLQQARNEKAVEVTRATISELERTRLQRSLNVELHLVLDEKGRRGLRVAWVRRQDARSGFTLYDESGRWLNMPEQIEAAIYDPKITPAAKPTAPAATSPAPETAPATQEQPTTYAEKPEKVVEEPARHVAISDRSELDEFFGAPSVTARQTTYETIWPTTETEYHAWLKQQGWNGKETRDALGTDAKSWLKQQTGRTWADVAKQVHATLKGL